MKLTGIQHGEASIEVTETRIPQTPVQGIRASLRLLSRPDRFKYALVVVAQMATSFLDLVGVLLIGVVALLATAAIQGTAPPETIQRALSAMGMSDMSGMQQVAVVSVVAAVVLLGKSVIAGYLMRRVFRFLGSRQAGVSTALTTRLLKQPLLFIERRSSQETVYAVSNAVIAMITTTLGSLAILLSEVFLLLLLVLALFLIDPLVTIASFAYFAVLGFGLQKGLSEWSGRTGATLGATAVQGQKQLQEALASFREIGVLGRRGFYVTSIGTLFERAGRAQGDQLFIGQISKITYEAALVLGVMALAAWEFATSSPLDAIATLSLFLAAATRVLPSMLRINSLLLTIRSGVAQAQVLFPFVADLDRQVDAKDNFPSPSDLEGSLRLNYPGFTPEVEVKGVTLVFPGAHVPTLNNVTLRIFPGSRVALVGSTGAGKSTLVDVILGVTLPDAGEVRVSGMSVDEAISRWPGALAYVPQNVAMIDGSIRDNVALGLTGPLIDDDAIWEALRMAHLEAFLSSTREGLDTFVGERGVRLSGGQRQRLGLARALYSRPKLLVLDEATSALDSETEVLVSETLESLSAEVTTITVAHRLATIRQADIVVYLENGHIVASGTFDEVRQSSAAFNHQAELLGL